jgi:hypothetical protein
MAAGLVMLAAGAVRAGVADPFADQVVSYTSGTLSSANASYVDPSTALGSPSRYTGTDPYAGAVTPFSPAWLTNQIVAIGVGGSLTLRFNQPVMNDPANPYGIDLLVFGNTGYVADMDYDRTSGALFGNSTQGRLEVSQDGTHWVTVSGVQPDGPFPTLGYQDVTDPYSSPAGSLLTDFNKPVNPAFDASGKSLAQIVAGYNGSGGGTGVDIGSTGLDSISFVRISYLGTSGDLEIDAVSRVTPVPGPGTLVMLPALGAAMIRWRRR